jgi:hypothetical protein
VPDNLVDIVKRIIATVNYNRFEALKKESKGVFNEDIIFIIYQGYLISDIKNSEIKKTMRELQTYELL